MVLKIHALLVPLIAVAGFFGPGLQLVPAVAVFVLLPLILTYSRATLMYAEKKEFLVQVRNATPFASLVGGIASRRYGRSRALADR